MVKGVTAARDSMLKAASKGAGISGALRAAGLSWAARAGGTSGVLWGAAVEAFAATFDDSATEISDADVVKAVRNGVTKISELGRANLGDKTMLDSMAPFVEILEREFAIGNSLRDSLISATKSAKTAAEATAELRPKIGRARPLAERSVGTPDAGAVSFALIVEAIALR
jgi:D-erythrulose 4-kinase